MLEAAVAYFASRSSSSYSFVSSSSSSPSSSPAGAGRETSRKNPISTAEVLAAEGLELIEAAGLEHPEPADVSGNREGRPSSESPIPSSESERDSVDRLLSGTTNDSDDLKNLDLGSSGSGDGEASLRNAAARISRMGNLLAVAAFWVSHTSSVYATKALLSRPGRTTRGIVLITWCQCVASFFLVLALGTLGERQEKTKGPWRSPLLTEMSKALPTNALLGGWNSESLLGGSAGAVGLASVLFSLAVFSDNACLGVVNASFFQVARALTLPLVTLFGAVNSRSLPPRDLILPCALCIAGFALGVRSQTPEAFWDGTSMGVMASVLTAAYTMLLARAEPREAWRVTYVTNRNASVLLVPAAVYVGMGDPTYLSVEPFLLKDGYTMLLAVMATVLPALAGVSTMWQAQTGLGATGQAASFVGRAAFSHMLAYYVFGNPLVVVGEVGCCLVLAGLALYASARGGAAVAQAGNVAVPGAARDHFFSPSFVVEGTGSGKSEACQGVLGGRTSLKKGKYDLVRYDEEAGDSKIHSCSSSSCYGDGSLKGIWENGSGGEESPLTVGGTGLRPWRGEGREGQPSDIGDDGEFGGGASAEVAKRRTHSRWRGRSRENDGRENEDGGDAHHALYAVPTVTVTIAAESDGFIPRGVGVSPASSASNPASHPSRGRPKSAAETGRSRASSSPPAVERSAGEARRESYSFEDELRSNRGGVFAAINDALALFAREGSGAGGSSAGVRRRG